MAALKYWDGTAWRTLGDPVSVVNNDVNFGGYKATMLGTPTAPGDAATKAYVDAVPVLTDLPQGTSFPDGYEVYVQKGPFWCRFHWNASVGVGTGLYPWICMGGFSAYSTDGAAEARGPTGSTAYFALATTCSIVLPWPGAYHCRLEIFCTATSVGSWRIRPFRDSIANGLATLDSALSMRTAADYFQYVHKQRIYPTAACTVVLGAASTTTGVSINFVTKEMFIDPVAVEARP